MENIALDATQIKRELTNLKGKYAVIKGQLADEFQEDLDPKTVSDEVFGEVLARSGHMPQGLVQAYLSIRDRMSELENQLGQFQAAVFNETASKIRLPRAVELLPAMAV